MGIPLETPEEIRKEKGVDRNSDRKRQKSNYNVDQGTNKLNLQTRALTRIQLMSCHNRDITVYNKAARKKRAAIKRAAKKSAAIKRTAK